ncbi:DinB family protein [Chitinophagaceae bacterium MMS25-I14]
MALNQNLIAELKKEAASTRKMLERVPAEQFGWKPHEKSMALGRLAAHVAELAGWTTMTIATDGLDFATMDYKPFQPQSTEDLVKYHDQEVENAIAALENATDEHLAGTWTMRNGEHVIMAAPRATVLRGAVNNHTYHHRGQLSVYLRLLDIPVPGVYGPTADEQ